jgi:amidase
MNTAFWSATRLAQALRTRKLGAVELFDLYAARIRQHNRALNAICVMDLDAGRKAARAADRAKGKKGPQYGDYRTIDVARLVGREYFAFTPPPGYD